MQKQMTNYGDNEIKQCCKCGRYMRFNIKYINGRPFVGWECVCGYNEPVIKIFYSNRTIK